MGLVSIAQAQQKPVPETHTVRKGDTLWDIAKQYLGDPFLWPDIYRLNTLVVEDPHWIYPGEVLRLAPSATATTVPPADTAQPPAQGAAPGTADSLRIEEPLVTPEQPQVAAAEAPDTTPLFPPSRGAVRMTLRSSDIERTRTLRRSEFYSSGFLTESEKLPFGRVIGPVIPVQIPSRELRLSVTLYGKIAIEPPEGATYQVGDSLLIADASKRIDPWGQVVAPTGLARVVSISEGTPIAEVIAVYGAILGGQVVLPVERFTDPGSVRPLPVADGLQARVIGWPSAQELKTAANVLFIDKGRQDGVAPGDVFELRRQAGRHPDGTVTIADVMATVQVVRVRERTATTRVVRVLSPNIPRGTVAYQVAKLPS